jgi:hypothetical protein
MRTCVTSMFMRRHVSAVQPTKGRLTVFLFHSGFSSHLQPKCPQLHVSTVQENHGPQRYAEKRMVLGDTQKRGVNKKSQYAIDTES